MFVLSCLSGPDCVKIAVYSSNKSADMKILVTGASGLVGSAVVHLAQSRGLEVLGQVRQHALDGCVTCVKQITVDTDWRDVLHDVECVVHCAARVHQMTDSAENPLEAFRAVNTQGTLNLARQAAEAGVKRFVFVSSIKVNGENTSVDQPFVPETNYIPSDPYGLSKYEAESGLKAIQAQTGLEIVIVRPPLVYGPGVKANFLSMMNWMRKGIPLPLGAIHNRRSLVFLDNLADLILLCCEHPMAANRTFLVSDNCDVSTSQLLAQIAQAMGQPNRLLPIPASWLRGAAALIGKGDVAQRVCGNLQVDITHTMQTLGWTPPYTFAEGIQQTVDDYMQSGKPD